MELNELNYYFHLRLWTVGNCATFNGHFQYANMGQMPNCWKINQIKRRPTTVLDFPTRYRVQSTEINCSNNLNGIMFKYNFDNIFFKNCMGSNRKSRLLNISEDSSQQHKSTHTKLFIKFHNITFHVY